jgi:Tfp pilus assembly protein PilF
LEKATVLAPEEARYAYVYAIALNSAGRGQDAITTLKEANSRHLVDAEILTALSTISRDLGDRAAAVAYAKQLVNIAPNSRRARSLLNSLQFNWLASLANIASPFACGGNPILSALGARL